MYVKQPKKLLILNILDILRKYTDEDHRLSQKEIADILKNEYDMKADRKAIRRNLLNLMDCGYNIEYSETIRNVPVRDKQTGEVLRDSKTGKPIMEENELWSDFYLKSGCILWVKFTILSNVSFGVAKSCRDMHGRFQISEFRFHDGVP